MSGGKIRLKRDYSKGRHVHVGDSDCSTSDSDSDSEEDEHNFLALAVKEDKQPTRFANSPRGKSVSFSLPPVPLDDNSSFVVMSADDACIIEDEMPALASDSDDNDNDDGNDVFQSALQREWLIDTAAHFHATSNPSNLHDIQDLPQPVRLQLADQGAPPINCHRIGKAHLTGHGRSLITLNDVLLAPCKIANIIGIHAATNLCPDL